MEKVYKVRFWTEQEIIAKDSDEAYELAISTREEITGRDLEIKMLDKGEPL